MSVETGAPDGKDFHVESHKDDDDEKDEAKSPFSLLESLRRHGNTEEDKKDAKESENEENKADLVSLFQTEPTETEESEEVPTVQEVPEEIETVVEEEYSEEEVESLEATVPAPSVEEVPTEPEEEPIAAEEPATSERPRAAEEPEEEVEEDPEEFQEAPPEVPPPFVPPEFEAEEPEEEPEPVTVMGSNGSSGGGSQAPQTVIPLGADTLSRSPTPNTNRGSNALAALAGVGSLYAAHKAKEAGREVVKEEKARTEADHKLAETQAQQQIEFNRKLAELRGAQEAAADAAVAQAAVERAKVEKTETQPRLEVPTKPEVPVEVPTQTMESKAPSTEKTAEKKSTAVEQVEQPVTQAEKASSVAEIIAERRANKQHTPEAQKTPELPEIPTATFLDPKEIFKANFDEKPPEILLQQSEALAEQNVAQEKLYERRHEIKDVASSLADGLGAGMAASTSGGELFAKDSPEQRAMLGTEFDKAEFARRQELQDTTSQAYKQAMWAGFWGAAVILVAIAIWGLLG